MTQSIDRSRIVTAAMVFAASLGLMISTSAASASDLETLVVVSADDDNRVYTSAIAPAAYQADVNRSSRQLRLSRATAPSREHAPSYETRVRIAWPYTARTTDRK